MLGTESGRRLGQLHQAVDDPNRAPDPDDIPRRGPSERQSPRDASHVLDGPERLAHLVGQSPIADQSRHAVVPACDLIKISGRPAEPVANEPAPHRGSAAARSDSPKKQPDDRPLRAAITDRLLDLESTQTDRIDDASAAGLFSLWGTQVRQRWRTGDAGPCRHTLVTDRLRLAQIPDQRPGRRHSGVVGLEPKARERRHAELLQYRLRRLVAPKVPRGSTRAGDLQTVQHPLRPDRRPARTRLGVHQLTDRARRQLVGEVVGLGIKQRQFARRKLRHRDRRGRVVAGFREHDRRHAIHRGPVQQRIIDERAGRDDLRHHALGLARVLDLIGDRHAVTQRHELAEIILELVVGDARQRHAAGPLRQCQPELLRDKHRVVVEKLIEIAHAEQKNALGVLLFEPRVLAHRWCGFAVAHGPGR